MERNHWQYHDKPIFHPSMWHSPALSPARLLSPASPQNHLQSLPSPQEDRQQHSNALRSVVPVAPRATSSYSFPPPAGMNGQISPTTQYFQHQQYDVPDTRTHWQEAGRSLLPTYAAIPHPITTNYSATPYGTFAPTSGGPAMHHWHRNSSPGNDTFRAPRHAYSLPGGHFQHYMEERHTSTPESHSHAQAEHGSGQASSTSTSYVGH